MYCGFWPDSFGTRYTSGNAVRQPTMPWHPWHIATFCAPLLGSPAHGRALRGGRERQQRRRGRGITSQVFSWARVVAGETTRLYGVRQNRTFYRTGGF